MRKTTKKERKENANRFYNMFMNKEQKVVTRISIGADL